MEDSYSNSTPVFVSLGKAMSPEDPKHVSPEEPLTALSGNKVGVEIEPETKGNKVNVQLCSLSLIFNCCLREKNRDIP